MGQPSFPYGVFRVASFPLLLFSTVSTAFGRASYITTIKFLHLFCVAFWFLPLFTHVSLLQSFPFTAVDIAFGGDLNWCSLLCIHFDY